MPSQKSRSKEDTWTTKELDSALNDDRERQRRERREKREGKEKSSTRDDKRNTKERVIRDDTEKKKSRESDERRRERPSKDDRQRELEREERRKKREGAPEKKSSSHRSGDDRHKREKSREEPIEKKSSRHRSDDVDRKRTDRHRSNDVRDDDRRRHDKPRESEDRKRSDRHKERDDDDRKRRHKREENDDGRDKRRSEQHRRKEDKGDDEREKRRKEKHEEEDREKRRRERKELKESSSSRSKIVDNDSEKENGKQSEDEEENGNDYNYDDDFEDYDDDFEEDDDDSEEEQKKPQPIKSEDREMSDLLKALDEENARLAAGSADVDSNKSDYSDQYHDNHESKNYPKPVSRGRTVINFVNAKQRAVDQKVSDKTRKRGKDLLKLIEFDHASFDIFDLPPVKEYELYIRSFGRTDTKQAYIQTNEDNLDRDIQTEEIELQDKWTQHPADDLLGCGGDNVETEKQELKTPASELDSTRMVSFLSKAAQAIGILLNEESTTSNEDGEKGIKSNLSASDGYHQLGVPLILKDRYVTYANYSPNQPNYLLTCYSMPSQDSEYTSIRKGIICVWNIMEPSNPQKYLACESQPNCCCFSPNRTSLVCAGMTDGSLVIWDLREQGFMHRMIKVDQEEYLFRFPTYNTAGVSESENHHSPVQSLVPVFPDPTSSQYQEETDNSGLSFQLASVEKNGSVNLWVVTEIPSPDSAGSEVDLGLSPGGKIKLVKSSTIKLNSPLKLDKGENLQAFEFKLSTCDLNHFYVGTDTGYVIHGVRFGSSAFPRGHTSVIDTPLKVKSIDFSPFGYPYLLAGCSDGSVHLYHTKLENPLVSWNDLSECQPCCIQSVRWSRSRAAVFFVLDDNSNLFTFDLLEGDSRPVHVDKITSGKAVYMTLNNDSRILGSGLNKCPQLLLALDNGSTELHNIKQNLIEDKTLEGEFLKKFNERF